MNMKPTSRATHSQDAPQVDLKAFGLPGPAWTLEAHPKGDRTHWGVYSGDRPICVPFTEEAGKLVAHLPVILQTRQDLAGGIISPQEAAERLEGILEAPKGPWVTERHGNDEGRAYVTVYDQAWSREVCDLGTGMTIPEMDELGRLIALAPTWLDEIRQDAQADGRPDATAPRPTGLRAGAQADFWRHFPEERGFTDAQPPKPGERLRYHGLEPFEATVLGANDSLLFFQKDHRPHDPNSDLVIWRFKDGKEFNPLLERIEPLSGEVIGRPDLKSGQVVRYANGRTGMVEEAHITGFKAKDREEAQILLEKGKFIYPTALIPSDDQTLVPGLKVKTLHVTYDIVTEESAKDGDFAEIGSEDMTMFTPEEDAVEGVLQEMRKHGPFETSRSPWAPGAWYSGPSEPDFRTGEHKRMSYHLGGFTPEEEEQVFNELKGRGLVL